MRLWRWLQCRVTGHPGVFRQWEWKPAAPQWREREDAWTCIRCDAEFPSIPLGATSYIVARPYMDATVITQINRAVESYGDQAVRVRAGDPNTRQPRPSL
jgi:hypothetical protein